MSTVKFSRVLPHVDVNTLQWLNAFEAQEECVNRLGGTSILTEKKTVPDQQINSEQVTCDVFSGQQGVARHTCP